MNFFVNKNQVNENKIYIEGMDVNHIKNVLRHKEGDILNIVCKDLNLSYEAKIENFLEKQIECIVLNKKENIDKDLSIDIYQGLPKADKMETIIQKCSELGVDKIIPVSMKRCVVKLDKKDEEKKISRWQTISEVAAKQCQREDILKIENLINIETVCQNIEKYDIVLVAYEKENENYLKNEIENIKNIHKDKISLAVVIGPEGGLEDTEVEKLKENNAKIISLGKRILRTETAPIVVSTILMYELGDIGGKYGTK